MSPRAKFWSKFRNRGIVYALGFIVLFGSYVIGAPNFSINHAKKPKKKVKPEQVVAQIDNSNDQSIPEEGIALEQNENAPVLVAAATPAEKVPTSIPSTSPSSNDTYSGGENLSYMDETMTSMPYSTPMSQMSMAASVKDEIKQRLEDGPKDYPYQVPEREDSIQVLEEEKNTEKKDKFSWPVRGAFRNQTKSASNNASSKTSSSGSSASVNSGTSGTSITGKGSSFQSSKKPDGVIHNENLNEGTIEYDPNVYNPMDPWLVNFYSHIHIHSFKKGLGGSSKFPSFNFDQENEFPDIRSVIFTPPDWQMEWKLRPNQVIGATENHLLPLGKNGSITIQVTDGYFIFNGEGADFLIVENPFCYEKKMDGTQELVKGNQEGDNIVCSHEYAKVSVSDTIQGPFKEFPCNNSSLNAANGCAGVIPNVYNAGDKLRESGGDSYDLQAIHLPKDYKVRFIRIMDTGSNGDGLPGTVGFDLDSFVPFNLMSVPNAIAPVR